MPREQMSRRIEQPVVATRKQKPDINRQHTARARNGCNRWIELLVMFCNVECRYRRAGLESIVQLNRQNWLDHKNANIRYNQQSLPIGMQTKLRLIATITLDVVQSKTLRGSQSCGQGSFGSVLPQIGAVRNISADNFDGTGRIAPAEQ